MADDAEAAAPDTTTDDANPTKLAPTHIHDWFLASLVGWANAFNIELGITLTIGGTVISGELISGKRYFEELSTIVSTASGGSEPLKSGIAEALKGWTVIYDTPEPLPDGYVPPQPTYIHLRDALWIYPDGKVVPGNGGVLWRGKLSAVDGFSLGTMRPTRN